MTEDPFADPEFAARYVDGPQRFVSGHHDLLCMGALLLAEDAPDEANMLVVGAGGGIKVTRGAQRAGETAGHGLIANVIRKPRKLGWHQVGRTRT